MNEIVVGVDGSAGAQSALHYAAQAARRRDARLVAVHAYRLPLAYAGAYVEPQLVLPELEQGAKTLLADALAQAGPALAGITVEEHVVADGAAAALLDAAAEAALLVVGTRRAGGFPGLQLGSVSEHCARQAPCPVVVVPTEWVGRQGPIVVGVDDSPAATAALRWALQEAAAAGTAVEAVHVYLPYTPHRPYGAEFMEIASPGSEQRLRTNAAEILAAALDAASANKSAVAVDRRVEAGDTARVLIDAAQQASLLVVGSRGYGPVTARLIGSVSRKCLHHAACPVVIVGPSQ